jgi:hypothetical protein
VRRQSARRAATASWLLAALLFATHTAAAQEPADGTTPDDPVSLRLPLTVYASSAVADLYTTHAALQHDAFYERNPMGAWLDEQPTALVAFSAAADVAIVWSLHRWLAPRHSRLLRAGLYAAAGVRFWLAARNASALRAYERRLDGR